MKPYIFSTAIVRLGLLRPFRGWQEALTAALSDEDEDDEASSITKLDLSANDIGAGFCVLVPAFKTRAFFCHSADFRAKHLLQ